ncbi:MAG: hypothetical protein D3904_17030, partial [Candidatus Electrothrix sp. EH2]|nr:hypothetical protein [Candidatus Electrothrix sp. EH2]
QHGQAEGTHGQPHLLAGFLFLFFQFSALFRVDVQQQLLTLLVLQGAVNIPDQLLRTERAGCFSASFFRRTLFPLLYRIFRQWAVGAVYSRQPHRCRGSAFQGSLVGLPKKGYERISHFKVNGFHGLRCRFFL